jgi:hypothetical protein
MTQRMLKGAIVFLLNFFCQIKINTELHQKYILHFGVASSVNLIGRMKRGISL